MTKSKVKSRKWIGSSLDGFIFLIVSLNVSIKKTGISTTSLLQKDYFKFSVNFLDKILNQGFSIVRCTHSIMQVRYLPTA